MKHLIIIFSFLILSLSVWGQIVIVNNGTPAHIKCSQGPSCTTLGINTVGASIEFAGCYGYTADCGVVSFPVNIWYLVGGSCFVGGTMHTCLYQAYGPPSTSTSQTATFTGTYEGGFFSAYIGTPPDATAFDKISGAGSGPGSTTISPGSLTPASPNEFIISIVGGSMSTTTLTVDSGLSVLDSFPYSEGLYFGGGLATLVDSSTTPIILTWDLKDAAGYGAAALVAAFKPAIVASVSVPRHHGGTY